MISGEQAGHELWYWSKLGFPTGTDVYHDLGLWGADVTAVLWAVGCSRRAGGRCRGKQDVP